MPGVDDPFGIAASLPGQVASLKAAVKDLSVNRTQSPNALTVGAGGLTVTGPSNLAALNVGGYTLAQIIAAAYVPQANQTSASGFTLTTGYAAVASFTFTVPAGCTRALINASGSITAESGASSGDYGYALVQINGVSGPESKGIWSTSNAPSIPASSAQSLSGLTPGATIPIIIYGHLATGPGVSSGLNPTEAALSATALFLP